MIVITFVRVVSGIEIQNNGFPTLKRDAKANSTQTSKSSNYNIGNIRRKFVNSIQYFKNVFDFKRLIMKLFNIE